MNASIGEEDLTAMLENLRDKSNGGAVPSSDALPAEISPVASVPSGISSQPSVPSTQSNQAVAIPIQPSPLPSLLSGSILPVTVSEGFPNPFISDAQPIQSCLSISSEKGGNLPAYLTSLEPQLSTAQLNPLFSVTSEYQREEDFIIGRQKLN